IACFQETKWKGSRAREGNGYKLWYSGFSTARNGIGVIVAERLKDDVVRVTRRSNRIRAISVVIDGESVNVISTYAPQVGLSDAEKKRAFPGEACSSRHRLVIVDVLFKRKRHKREATGRPRILWKNLKGEEVETFRATVSEKLSALDIGNVRYIKDEGGRTIVREEEIRKRWKEYFSSLFNESPHIVRRPERSGEVRSSRHQMNYDCYYSRINQREVRAALQRMG
nr:hypothetical protein [Tanacetum cinerariifolium]